MLSYNSEDRIPTVSLFRCLKDIMMQLKNGLELYFTHQILPMNE